MKKKQRWSELMLLAALLAGALAPASALAGSGDRLRDLPGDPPILPEMYEFGDPEPTGGGAPQQAWTDFATWKQILLASLQLRFGVPAGSSIAAATTGPARICRVTRGLPK